MANRKSHGARGQTRRGEGKRGGGRVSHLQAAAVVDGSLQRYPGDENAIVSVDAVALAYVEAEGLPRSFDYLDEVDGVLGILKSKRDRYDRFTASFLNFAPFSLLLPSQLPEAVVSRRMPEARDAEDNNVALFFMH